MTVVSVPCHITRPNVSRLVSSRRRARALIHALTQPSPSPSFQSAVAHNVSAADIQAFLERNAHPRMASQTPVLPDTVVNQVMLWARERNRLEFAGTSLDHYCYAKHPHPPTLALP